MTTFILDKRTASLPIQEILSHSSDGVIELRNEGGRLLATLFLAECADTPEYAAAVVEAQQNISELRRRANSPRENDVTSQQLLDHLHALTL